MAEAQQGLKDRDLQKYYEAMLELFTTPGWKYLVEDVEKIKAVGNTLAGIGSMEELHFRRGQLDMIEKIITQPDVVRAAYDMLLAEDNE